jgi:hypothetical protein
MKNLITKANSIISVVSPNGGGGNTNSIIGEVNPPPGVENIGGGIEGIPIFVNMILRLLIVGAGIYAVFNLVIAGYAFMSAGDDPKKVAGAWAKIWQTLMGLAFAAGAFVLAAIFGKILFNDYNALLQFKIFGVN